MPIRVLKSLKLTKFRGFESYMVDSLARVNLVVGKNNSGKTSLLEAVELLVSGGNPASLSESAQRRDEMRTVEIRRNGYRRVPSIAHLFYNHICEPGVRFEIRGSRSADKVSVELLSLDNLDEKVLSGFLNKQLASEVVPAMAMTISLGTRKEPHFVFPVSEDGLLLHNVLLQGKYRSPALFLSLTSMEPAFLSEAWNVLVTEGREHEVVEDMRLLMPNIDSIHFLSGDRNSKGGILIGLCDARSRYPLGTFGDGMRRLLALRLALANSSDGFVLVDEVDTGLHWTVIAAMWRLLVEVARKHGVQLFTTTHSYDCIYGLASMIKSYPELADEVSIQKVETSLPRAVSIQGEDIPAAFESGIDFR